VLLKLLQEKQLSEKSNSGAALLSMMQNPEIQAYLLFRQYILDDFNKSFSNSRNESSFVSMPRKIF